MEMEASSLSDVWVELPQSQDDPKEKAEAETAPSPGGGVLTWPPRKNQAAIVDNSSEGDTTSHDPGAAP